MRTDCRTQNSECRSNADPRDEVEYDLKLRTQQFALRIVRLFRVLPRTEEARIIGKQMLRSGTSVGANYRAACRSRSRSEFVAKLGIVLEEADETAFWPQLIRDTGILHSDTTVRLLHEANELTVNIRKLSANR